MNDVDAGLKRHAGVRTAIPEEAKRARGAGWEHPLARQAEPQVAEGPHRIAVVRDEPVENLAADGNRGFVIARVRVGQRDSDQPPQAIDLAIHGHTRDERRLRGVCVVGHAGDQ